MTDRQIQSFALDAKGDPVDIRNVADKSGPFSCPCCHRAMIAKTGNIRAWHFAHKDQICSYESYVHALAKIRIAKWFNERESIILEMESREICADHGDCPLRDSRHCSRRAKIRHDLKKYYHGCELERSHGGFVADILCPHHRTPLFIEIFTTHECTEEKKASGNRIIELAIRTEEDIDRIVSSSVLRESESVRLYGFRNRQKPLKTFRKPLVKYILDKSGESRLLKKFVDCRNFLGRHPNAMYEALIDLEPDAALLLGKCLARRKGMPLKDCDICFWAGDVPGYGIYDWFGGIFNPDIFHSSSEEPRSRVCKIYKKCGNPKHCKDNDAQKCRMFRQNREFMDGILAECGDSYIEVH